MKILIACEFSATVRDCFLAYGHDAWSCDLLPCEKDSSRHFLGDVREVLDNRWDLIIAHPPCTFLTNSSVGHLVRNNQRINPERWENLKEAIEFFSLFKGASERVAIENPIPHGYARDGFWGEDKFFHGIGKYDQIIQPWQFGHPESKATCLWLKNLPKLQTTNILSKPATGTWNNQTSSGQNKIGPSPDRWKKRSITYQGIAEAMVSQWGYL